MKVNPIKLDGDWKAGFALDVQTLSSVYIGDDEYGHPQFETRRSEVGELVYRLKYARDESVVRPLADTAAAFVKFRRWPIDVIVPVPPSRKSREYQPLLLLADAVGQALSLPVLRNCIAKVKATPELKSISDYAERLELLVDAYRVSAERIENRTILLLDDLYRSGATLKAAAGALSASGGAQSIYVLTFTKTRVKR
ncbi:MAG: ComF family protein [Candidatus Hydrogenedentes bacterium]|nr:ComF family protein [Candidatus Hydrogenedentota bacterium]